MLATSGNIAGSGFLICRKESMYGTIIHENAYLYALS